MHADMLGQISIAIIVALALAFVAKLSRQPLILAYLVAGVLLGTTQGVGWINFEDIKPISELGLILLLFMIGLEIKLKEVREAGKTVLVAGLGQAVVGIGLGVLVSLLLGFPLSQGRYDALYLSMAVSLSSTIIVVKLLYDKRELDSVAGRITLGILIFEDIRAILFIAIQPTLHNPAFLILLGSILKTIGLVLAAFAVSRYVLPRLLRLIAKQPDLMVLAYLAWCFLLAGAAGGLKLSWEMGAFIAGLSVSAFPYNHDIIAKITSLRDFFITLFFISLGAQIPRPNAKTMVIAMVISMFLVLSRFVSITPFLAAMRAGQQSSFVPALNLSQISEFSLVICTIGLGLGHIDARLLSIVVFVLAITSVTSTYSILYSQAIFRKARPLLRWLGIRDHEAESVETRHFHTNPIVFLGFAHSASSTLYELLARNRELALDIAAVDFNPRVKQELDHRKIRCIYGDISYPDTLHHAGIHDARVIVSTISDPFLKGTTNARMLTQCKMLAPHAQVIVTAEVLEEGRDLYRQGAAYVYFPRLVNTRELAEVVAAAYNGSLDEIREAARMRLESRREVLP